MPSSMPDAPTLLRAAIKYLEDELMPELSGYHRFKCRVTVNVLSTVKRELEQRTDFDEKEIGRLEALLGHTGNLPELSAELAGTIRAGRLSPEDPQLRQHIRASLREALSVNNPRWIRE